MLANNDVFFTAGKHQCIGERSEHSPAELKITYTSDIPVSITASTQLLMPSAM
jgi:hypothetical protein